MPQCYSPQQAEEALPARTAYRINFKSNFQSGLTNALLAQLPQQLALEVEKDWICDFFSHYISLVRILVGNRNPIMSSRIF